MSKAKTHKTIVALVLGVACLAGAGDIFAAPPLKFSGTISGTVEDSLGVPQLGASVVLSNGQDRRIQKVLTDASGRFRFEGLVPDHYSVQVTSAAFLPVIQKEIMVQPGTQSLMAVHLNSFLSTVQMSYPPMANGSLMTDDWKWVLRTATSTRPVMRFLPDQSAAPADGTARASVFSDTRGILRVSAGEGGTTTGVANEADMGTAFALATSIFGSNLLQVSGNVGYGSQTGVPAAAFRTSYSRNVMGGSPEVSLTMRQMFLPGRLAAAMFGPESNMPMLRTMSASFDDHTRLSDDITLKYGVTMDSVTFLERLNYLSPYARLTYDLGSGGTLDVTITSGNARPDLGGAPTGDADLQGGLNALGLFPRVSLRDAKAQVQRGDEAEVTYSRKVGERTYSVSAYHESVTNAALTLVGAAGVFGGADILPDLFSNSSIFNAGNFQSTGYSAAVTQNVGSHISATLMYGSEGALTTGNRELASGSAEELRAMLHTGRRHGATMRIAASVPRIQARVTASYQWADDQRWATPGNEYSTQASKPMPGLNICIRQPLPGLARRVEATADLRNMLAQGYLPVGMASGQQLMLVETPRSVRGGLAFIF
jgi:hypothetical protein